MHQLEYLDSVLKNGTDPLIAHNGPQIDRARLEVQTLTEGLPDGPILAHAQATLVRLQKLSGKPTEVAQYAPTVAQTAPVGQ